MDNNTDSGNQYAALKSAGVDVLLKPSLPPPDSLLHHKYAIIDGEDPRWNPALITGSHNWSNSAETSNSENTLVIHDARTANLYLQEFASRYAQFGGADAIVVGAGEPQEGFPLAYRLEQNYPNPYNPSTVVSCQWPVASEVKLVVYDILGRKVAVLADGRYPAGRYTFTFEADGLASGLYFCRLTAGVFIHTVKMTLVR
jgi:hypothetical protein